MAYHVHYSWYFSQSDCNRARLSSWQIKTCMLPLQLLYFYCKSLNESVLAQESLSFAKKNVIDLESVFHLHEITSQAASKGYAQNNHW